MILILKDWLFFVNFDLFISISLYYFLSSVIENQSGIDERSIRVFSQLFTHVMHNYSVHIATHYHYTIGVYNIKYSST